MSAIAEKLYRIVEMIDGEKGLKIISYPQAQAFKLWLLNWIK